jgi:hypothetical protein
VMERELVSRMASRFLLEHLVECWSSFNENGGGSQADSGKEIMSLVLILLSL